MATLLLPPSLQSQHAHILSSSATKRKGKGKLLSSSPAAASINTTATTITASHPSNDLHSLCFHPIATLSLLDQCSDVTRIRQIHARMLRVGLFFDPYSASRLITALCSLPISALDYACRVFHQIPDPNLYTWNTLIRALASSPDPADAILLFSRLLHLHLLPNNFTFPFVLKAASRLAALNLGRATHALVLKCALHSDIYILNSLIHFYASCSHLHLATQLFSEITSKDVVTWNSMIAALAQADCSQEALDLFQQMEAEGVTPNQVTMVSLLSACAKKGDLEFGKWIHSYIQTNGIPESLILSNALLDMYTKCGSLGNAQKLFDEMPNRDSVSWTTMLVGYAQHAGSDAARSIFNSMPSRDVASWNALISTYEQSGRPKQALSLFCELQLDAEVKPDQITLVSALSACAQLGALDMGCWIHAYIKQHKLVLNCHLATSLIDMYSKCGYLEKAMGVFQSMEPKDVFVWSAMIAGMAMHGHGKAAIDLFLQMQEDKVKPNAVTFTNVLCACSHAGLVDKGKQIFSEMLPLYGVAPTAAHYGCMVDILGRAGLLEEAVELIERMPISPHASAWGALLGACRSHGNLELGELACRHLLQLEPENDGAYVLLSNIYAKRGRWDDVSRLRKLMKDRGLRKEPSCSSMEVDGVVHEFLVGDISHPLSKKIYSKLDEVTSSLKSAGYVPNRSQLLQDIEEDVKEHALNLHSEKLAIAFGLISTDPPTPIRIVKNLRICGDCHSAAKLISAIYGREIVLRDRYRFHHFKEGHCSCMDFW